MKPILKILQILLPVAAIIFAALTINAGDDTRTALLVGCMSCVSLSNMLNMRAQRKEREQKED